MTAAGTVRARGLADSTALALVLIALFGAIYAGVARLALDAFPYSGDEYSLALQGELLAKGALKVAAPPHPEWFRIDHVVIDAWVRSKYPVGAPALLALGGRAGLAWLVTPLEAVVALLVVWHTSRRLLGARPALVALIALGAAPLFAFNAASFYAHTATTMWLAIAFAAIAGWTLSPRTGWLVLAGAAIGAAFLTRPVDALLFGAAMLALRSPRAVVITAVSALPLVAINLWYQAAQFGGPLTDGYHAYEPTFRALYGAETAANPVSLGHLVNPIQWWNHVDIYRAFTLDWTVPGAVIAAVFGARAIPKDHPARAMRGFSLAVIAVFVGSLMIMISDPDDGARPRYLSIVLMPLALLTAAGLAPLGDAIARQFGRRARTGAIVVAVVFALAQLAAFLQDRIPKVWAREGLYQAVAAQGVTRAVVVVRAQYPSRFARNGDFTGDVLYASPPPEVPAEQVGAAFPDRALWEAHEGVTWRLVRVR